jgi:hypothetical protein
VGNVIEAKASSVRIRRPTNCINQERADYILTVLGKHKARRYSQNTLKAAVDGFTSARGLPVDEKELTSLARTLVRKGALYSKLGRNNRLTNLMRSLSSLRTESNPSPHKPYNPPPCPPSPCGDHSLDRFDVEEEEETEPPGLVKVSWSSGCCPRR